MSRGVSSRFLFSQVRFFATAAAVPEGELTISQLNQMGAMNLQQTKIIDYSTIALPNVHGQKNK